MQKKKKINNFTKFDVDSIDLETILNNSFDVIYVSDSDGKTLRVSSACEHLWGLKAGDLIGKNVKDLEKIGIFKPSITRLVLEQRKKISAFQTTKNNQRLFVVGTPIFDEEGDIIRVVNASRNITELDMLKNEIGNLKQLLLEYRNELSDLQDKNTNNENLIFRSENMKQLFSLLYRVASFDSTVLITGETGVGKTVIAYKIHKFSDRRKKPFIKINCSAIPENLLESELFGYEKGAFTGANKKGKPGLIKLADTGTLFLDEISELSPVLQGKLLQVIQEKEFTPIGSIKSVKVNIRILAATNKNLAELVKQRKFREDIYYRLNVVSVMIPPLRKRTDDIVPLSLSFLEKFNKKYSQEKKLSTKILSDFMSYSWPGNVRELENIIERLVVTVNSKLADSKHLPEYMTQETRKANKSKIYIDIKEVIPLKEAKDMIEARLITFAMEKVKTTVAIAKILGVDQSTISRKLKKIASKQK